MSDAFAQEHTNNGDRGQFLEFIDEYQRADERVAEALGDRRELRKRIKEAGINMPGFDRARKLNGLSDELREIQRQAENQYMEWLGKPLGFQASMFEEEDELDIDLDEGPPLPDQIEICAGQGRAAATKGEPRTANPWPPESEYFAAWDQAWLAVTAPVEALRDEMVEKLGQENQAAVQRERRLAQRKPKTAAAEEAERRPPGRPKGATDRKPRKKRRGNAAAE